MVSKRDEEMLKFILAKRVANIGSVPLPPTNVFTAIYFERSFGPFKEPIGKVTSNLGPKYIAGKEVRW